jgi:hypothetical protein
MLPGHSCPHCVPCLQLKPEPSFDWGISLKPLWPHGKWSSPSDLAGSAGTSLWHPMTEVQVPLWPHRKCRTVAVFDHCTWFHLDWHSLYSIHKCTIRAGMTPVFQYSLILWQGNKTQSRFNFFRETALMETNIIMLSRVKCFYFPSYSAQYFTHRLVLKDQRVGYCFGFSFLPVSSRPYAVYVWLL